MLSKINGIFMSTIQTQLEEKHALFCSKHVLEDLEKTNQ